MPQNDRHCCDGTIIPLRAFGWLLEGRTVPRYYFDTDDGDTFIEGHEAFYPYSLNEVRLHAQAALADIARDVLPRGGNPQRTMACRARDESGKTVLMASLVLTVQENP
jgi:hypothetical protein